MVWSQLDPDKPHVAYAVVAVFSTVFSLCSLFVKEKLYLGEASAATIYGLIVGPHCLDWFNPISWGNYLYITLEISRVLLCIEIVAVAVELPKKYVWKHWFSIFLMLIPGMTAGWLIIGSFIYLVIPGIKFTGGLLIAACITATDPVLAQPIVGKGNFAKRVPAHLRNLLSAESGCNDGVSVPFVYLSLNLIMHAGHPSEIAKDWICVTVLYECGIGLLVGSFIGYIGRVSLKYAKRNKLVDYESSLAFYIMVALLCAGFGSILGMDDLLASFAAGTAFNWDGSSTEENEESPVSSVIDILLNMAYFVYFGAIIPWSQFNDALLGLNVWRLIILAIVVIFLRRIPAVLIMKVINPDIKDWKEALFVGHFGPIGVGAVFAAILAIGDLEAWVLHIHDGPTNEYPLGSPESQLIQVIWPVVCFLIITSIIVHGSSVAVLTLGRHLQSMTFTYTYTLQKTGDTDGGGKKWLNRLPRLERSGTSFSIKRVDTISGDNGENYDELMASNEKDKINSELNARIGITEKDDENMIAKTTGIPVRPAGGARRKQNRNKLKKLRGNKKDVNKKGRSRPALETLDLKTMSRHNTEFSAGGGEIDEDMPSPASPHPSQRLEGFSTETPSDEGKYVDNDHLLSLVPTNDGKSLVSENREGVVQSQLPIISANKDTLKYVSENFDLKASDLQPKVDDDGLLRIPTKGYKYSDKLVIEDQLGEVLTTVPSNVSSVGSGRHRSNTLKSIASALGVMKPESNVLIVPDTESVQKVLADVPIEDPVHPLPSAVGSSGGDNDELESLPTRSATRASTVGSVKGLLPKIKNIGNKLQPSDETVDRGLTGLITGRKHANTISDISSANKGSRSRASSKLHGFKVGDNIILEDDSGEIIGRFKFNDHKLESPHSSTPSGILNFMRPRDASVSAADLEKQPGQYHQQGVNDDHARLDDIIHGSKFEDKIKHFIKADKRTAIVTLPEHLNSRSSEGEYYENDEEEDDEEDDDDNDDDSEIDEDEYEYSEEDDNRLRELPVKRTSGGESKYERERRFGALHESKRFSDDEEEEPKTKY